MCVCVSERERVCVRQLPAKAHKAVAQQVAGISFEQRRTQRQIQTLKHTHIAIQARGHAHT